jgi:phosphohistidine phosphatase SixA
MRKHITAEKAAVTIKTANRKLTALGRRSFREAAKSLADRRRLASLCIASLCT